MGCMAASSVSFLPWLHSHPSASWRILKTLYLPILAHSSQRLACPGCPQSTIVQGTESFGRMDGEECRGKMEVPYGCFFTTHPKCFIRSEKHHIEPKVASFVPIATCCGMWYCVSLTPLCCWRSMVLCNMIDVLTAHQALQSSWHEWIYDYLNNFVAAMLNILLLVLLPPNGNERGRNKSIVKTAPYGWILHNSCTKQVELSWSFPSSFIDYSAITSTSQGLQCVFFPPQLKLASDCTGIVITLLHISVDMVSFKSD